MEIPSRSIVALVLTVIYSLIMMGPLAPLALNSPRVASALTGECSGNCDICGCSAERRANRSCCCWLKKSQKHDHKNVPDCCKKKRHRMTMLSCSCPCGGKKMPGLAGFETTEQLPYGFTQEPIPLFERSLFFCRDERLADLHGDPPDPPPKLTYPD